MAKDEGEGPDKGEKNGEPRAPDSEEPSTGFTFTQRERSGIPAITMRLLLLCIVMLGALWYLRTR